jgi:CheY-like chemotaxis protein
MKRVLVVEHDSLHRELIGEWLRAGGAQPVWPGAQLQHAADIDAILVDVTCQQHAAALLAPWRRAYPRAAVVLASGRFLPADTANDAMAVRLGATRILAKPFTRDERGAALELSTHPPPPAQPARR